MVYSTGSLQYNEMIHFSRTFNWYIDGSATKRGTFWPWFFNKNIFGTKYNMVSKLSESIQLFILTKILDPVYANFADNLSLHNTRFLILTFGHRCHCNIFLSVRFRYLYEVGLLYLLSTPMPVTQQDWTAMIEPNWECRISCNPIGRRIWLTGDCGLTVSIYSVVCFYMNWDSVALIDARGRLVWIW